MDDRDQPGVRFSVGEPPQRAPASPETAPPSHSIGYGTTAVIAIGCLLIGGTVGHALGGGSNAPQQAAAAGTSASAPTSAAPITVHGSLTLKRGAWLSATGSIGEECSAANGYSDISAGTAVTVGDQTGATIAVGQLQAGQVTADGCRFGFDVQAPAGRTSYTVTVSHRGTQVFSPIQMQEADMTLG